MFPFTFSDGSNPSAQIFATSIAPYSLRARNGAGVSMPIASAELDTVAPDVLNPNILASFGHTILNNQMEGGIIWTRRSVVIKNVRRGRKICLLLY
ncbi:hypothetical protein [Desulfosporosinus sp. BICA1-9]|uniref:non-homologous end-joining DNA ligase LigD n=1 Tax=Desulfosporosinus sp. BICA1-9 TaxID=1531958 RepID=UPI00345506DB